MRDFREEHHKDCRTWPHKSLIIAPETSARGDVQMHGTEWIIWVLFLPLDEAACRHSMISRQKFTKALDFGELSK